MKDECGSRILACSALLASSLALGCSGGEWFPEVDGPPPGDQRLYHSPLNTDPSLHPAQPAGVEADAERAARRERRNRH